MIGIRQHILSLALCAKLRSNHQCQYTNTQLRPHALSVAQATVSEHCISHSTVLITQSSPEGLPTRSLITKVTLGEVLLSLSSVLQHQYACLRTHFKNTYKTTSDIYLCSKFIHFRHKPFIFILQCFICKFQLLQCAINMSNLQC